MAFVLVYIPACLSKGQSLLRRMYTTVILMEYMQEYLKQQQMTKISIPSTSPVQTVNLNTLKQLLFNTRPTRVCVEGGHWAIIQRDMVPVL